MNKYTPLCAEMRGNGWSVDIFAVEVGARGYCAESIRCCLRQLGFTNKQCRKSLKLFSSCALKASFYVWMSRSSKEWESPENAPNKNFSLTKFRKSSVHSSKSDSSLNLTSLNSKVSKKSSNSDKNP